MDNKNIFALNLKKYMELKGKSRTDISDALGISYFTVSDWVNGKKYPRMDKVEMLANYFGIQKSDLIENKEEKIPTEETLTDGEKVWLDLYRKTPESSREMLMLLFQSFENIPESSQQMVLGMLRVVEKEKK
jgi:transcriptional regulator with XRE-family HTH domain